MRPILVAMLGTAAVACGTVEAPLPVDTTVDLETVTPKGIYALTSCDDAASPVYAPRCLMYVTLSVGQYFYYDSARIELGENRSVRWTIWSTNVSRRCSNPTDPACAVADTTRASSVKEGTYAVTADTLLTLTIDPPYNFYDYGAGLSAWPRITHANRISWHANTLQAGTYGQYVGAHTYTRIR